MPCRDIKIANKQVQSKLWNDIYSLVKSEEESDRIYHYLSSPQFISIYGDWQPRQINILRHGVTKDDEQLNNSGLSEIGLSEKGKEESEKTAHEIQDLDIKKIYTSPATRAEETAEILKKYTNAEVVTVEGLKPLNLGIYGGEKETEFNEKYYLDHPDESILEGESINAFLDRFLATINSLRHIPKDELILSHSKGLNAIRGLEQTHGIWNDKAKDIFLNHGISENSTEQLFNYFTWDTKVAPKLSELGEPKIEDIEQYINIPKAQPSLIQASLSQREAANRLISGFKLKPKYFAGQQVGWISGTGRAMTDLAKGMQHWIEDKPDFSSIKVGKSATYNTINFQDTNTGKFFTQDSINGNIASPTQGSIVNKNLTSAETDVNYSLKITSSLNNPKVESLFNRFYFANPEKFYSELLQLGTTKQQVDLLKEWNNQNNPKSVQDMIIGIMSDLTYIVEINTAKENSPYHGSIYNEEDGWQPEEVHDEPIERNTAHYSNLTVPGGTNYSENEIATPGIVPSIKGHAQFSTDNGVGWFRSDEQSNNQTHEEYLKQLKRGVRAADGVTISEHLIESSEVKGSKTRRILEVQSDLFQKSQVKKNKDGKWIANGKGFDTQEEAERSINLVSKHSNKENYQEAKEEGEKYFSEGPFGEKELSGYIYKGYIYSYYMDNGELNYGKTMYSKSIAEQPHKFLQLLNKDGNWVSFFIKSIVQDSAKKGYEKVLFPTGDTASKVEGHETLQEFKKQREDRIKKLEGQKKIKYGITSDQAEEMGGYDATFETKNAAQDYLTNNNLNLPIHQINNQRVNVEIKTLQDELKEIETNGFVALKPIHTFYETRIKNILDKIYGKDKVQRITDEHGNQWYELNLSPIRDLQTFFTSQPSQAYSSPTFGSGVQTLYQPSEGLTSGTVNTTSSSVPKTIDASISKLIDDQTKVRLDDTLNPETGQKRHDYYRTDENNQNQKAAGSVTSIKVDQALRGRKGSLVRRSEIEKEIHLLYAEYGTDVHKTAQDILNYCVDTNHELKAEAEWDNPDKVSSPVNQQIYEQLQTYIHDLLHSYEPSTKFFVEAKIFDPNFLLKEKGKIVGKGIGGSIDFLAIKPNGHYDIYDWKSQTNLHRTDILDWKKIAYNTQIEEYVRILKDTYGLTNPDKLRDIPINTEYHWVNGKPSKLTKIEIASFNITEIPKEQEYLKPLAADSELVKEISLREFLVKLKGINDALDRLRENEADAAKRHDLQEQRRQLQQSIQDIKLTNDASKFRDWANDLIDYVDNNIDKLTGTERRENKLNLEVLAGTNTYFLESISKLKDVSKNQELDQEIRDEAKQEISQLEGIASQAQILIKKLEIISDNISKNLVVEEKLGDPESKEREVDFLQRYVTDLSLIPIQNLQLVHKIITQAKSDMNAKGAVIHQKFTEIKKEFDNYANTQGLSVVEAFKKYLIDGTDEEGNLRKLNKYSDEYWTLYNKALREQNATWVKTNTVFNKEKYEKSLEAYKESVKLRSYGKTTSEDIEKERKSRLASFEKFNNVFSGEFNPDAYLNRDNHFLQPLEKWKSKKYENMESTPILKKTHDLFLEVEDYAYETGATRHLGTSFLPSEEASRAERKSRGLKKDWKFFGRYRVPEDVEFAQPKKDFRTGEILKEVRKPSVKRATNISLDLFDTYYKFYEDVERYNILKSIEGNILDLQEAERIKNMRGVNKYGIADSTIGKILGIKNKTNYEVLQSHIDALLYNKIDSDWDKLISIPGIPEKISLKRFFQDTITYFSWKTLTSPLPALSNFVGGSGNVSIIAKGGKHFTQKDLGLGLKDLGARDEKMKALLKYFNLSTEMHKKIKTNLSEFNKPWQNIDLEDLVEESMIMMRGTDYAVQRILQAALMRGIIIDEEDKFRYAKEYLQNSDKYKDMYSKPESEWKSLEKEFDKDLNILKETRSIYAQAELKDGKITFAQDIEKKQGIRSTKVDIEQAIKQDSKNVLGNMSDDDKALMKYNFLMRAVLQYRNWIPRLLRARFGGIYNNPDTNEVEFGYWNYFMSQLTKRNIIPLIELTIKSLVGNGLSTNIIDSAKVNYERMKSNAEDQGKFFNMSEDEFVHYHVERIRRFLRDLTLMLGFGAALYAWIQYSKTNDPSENPIDSYTGRALRKFYNEFSFYADPREFQQLLGQSIPLSGLLTELGGFVGSSFEALWGEITDNEELVQKQHMGRRITKLFPFGGSTLDMLGIISADFDQDWGIKPISPHF